MRHGGLRKRSGAQNVLNPKAVNSAFCRLSFHARRFYMRMEYASEVVYSPKNSREALPFSKMLFSHALITSARMSMVASSLLVDLQCGQHIDLVWAAKSLEMQRMRRKRFIHDQAIMALARQHLAQTC